MLIFEKFFSSEIQYSQNFIASFTYMLKKIVENEVTDF